MVLCRILRWQKGCFRYLFLIAGGYLSPNCHCILWSVLFCDVFWHFSIDKVGYWLMKSQEILRHPIYSWKMLNKHCPILFLYTRPTCAMNSWLFHVHCLEIIWLRALCQTWYRVLNTSTKVLPFSTSNPLQHVQLGTVPLFYQRTYQMNDACRLSQFRKLAMYYDITPRCILILEMHSLNSISDTEPS